MVQIEQIGEWSNGKWLTPIFPAGIKELVIDTRKVSAPANALFVALKTERRDGHDFVAAGYEKGIRSFLVQQSLDTALFPDANFILVKNTLVALQSIAAAYRRQFTIPVIGITGSNGKTVVKEWLFQLLCERRNIVRSPKSYNSQIGVPLSVWVLAPENNLGIFEAGISQPGEMERLEKIIRPSIGVFTNIGEAHSEGFLNQRQKIHEKLLLFRHASDLVYCSDYPELNETIVQYRNQTKTDDFALRLFTWSRKHTADLRITAVVPNLRTTTIKANYQDQEIEITIPFTDPASVENAIHCWCVLLMMNESPDYINDRMMLLQPVAMRLELRQGINDCTIINDAYNSDLTSLQIALDFLLQQRQHARHTVILSDILQIGKSDAELYEEVAASVGRRGVQRFIGIGPALHKHRSFFRANKKLRSFFFKTTNEFLKKFHLFSFDSEAILLKGARIFRFEKIDLLLEQKIHQTVLSINLSSLRDNLNVYKSQLSQGVRIMAMVKAFSYGSGSFEIASLLQFSGVDYLAVAYTDEGVALRKAGITLPVMVMSPDAISFDRMIAWKLEPEIYNMRSLQLFADMATTLGVKEYPIHIKLDTGMHRLGFMPSELSALTDFLLATSILRVASVFSHLAGSEARDLDDFTALQTTRFKEMSAQLIDALPYRPLLHLCNSAGVARHTALHFDMVRLGLGLHGIDPGSSLQAKLKQISTLKTTIAQIRTLKAGETVGYGRKGMVHNDCIVATICIGYADGYPRSLSERKAYVLIHGKKAQVLGVVCMDMCMVDITAIPEACEGDEVIVFGPELPLQQIADWAGTIPYEIMTGISQRVKRIYLNED